MKLRRVGLSVLSLGAVNASLLGCGSDPLPPAEPFEEEGIASLSRFVGRVAEDGHVTFTPVSDAEPGVTPQGFSNFTSGLVSLDTPLDGVGTGSCSGTQYCASVDLTNNTGRPMDNTFVEITKVTASPPGAAVAWTTPFTATSAYRNYFVNSGAPQAASYGDLAIGETKNVEWKWNINAGSVPTAGFDFIADVYGSFRRFTTSGVVQGGRPSLNACAIAGSVNVMPGADDVQADFALPFPFTLYDNTYDRAVVSSNGFLLFYKTGEPAPSAGFTNTSLGQSAPVGIYVFWDDLKFDPTDGVCSTLSGTRGKRSFTISWSNARITTSQPGQTSWTPQRITNSLTLVEATDAFTLQYDAPIGGPITTLTQGLSATIGVRAVLGGSQVALQFSMNKAYLPAATSGYGYRIIRDPLSHNP